MISKTEGRGMSMFCGTWNIQFSRQLRKIIKIIYVTLGAKMHTYREWEIKDFKPV